ncbi:MAG: hypothetical protein WA082_04585 [Candidatus Moraniibacteriota bacterium]
MSKEKKQRREQNAALLEANGIKYQFMDEPAGHIRIGQFDMWISTGKFFNRETRRWGDGIMNLINYLGGKDARFCGEHDDESCFGEVIQCNSCRFFFKE